MATYTVGSGYSYSTIQAAEDAMAATRTEDEIAEIYNTAEYSGSTTLLTVAGHTGNFYCIFRAATGQGFADNASVRTNELRYNQSNGVAISHSTDGSAIVISNNYVKLENLQIKTSSGYGHVIQAANDSNIILKDLFLQSNNRPAAEGNGGQYWINVIAYCPNSGNTYAQLIGVDVHRIGCAAIRPSNQTDTGTAFQSGYNTSNLQSCLAFGFSTVAAGSWSTANCFNNATDQASGLPGTGNVYNVTYNATTPFTQADATGNIDLRSIASTALAAAGYYDGTNAPLDISRYTRANPPTIGHWEIAAAGGGSSVRNMVPIISYSYKRKKI